jgi:hypothetical protein
MDSMIFAPSTECSTCNHLIFYDPNSDTGASATRPCELWSEDTEHGFCLEARNFGSCELLVFIRQFDQDWPLSSNPMTLTNPDGSVVLGENGLPVTALAYEPAFRFRSFVEFQEFNVGIERRACGIGILCIRASPTTCPICDVELVLTLSCGEKLFYKIAPPVIANSLVNTPVTISGNVDCILDSDNINVNNLRAQLISCATARGVNGRVIDTVPLVINGGGSTTSNVASYIFRNVLVECFRVNIICTGTITSTTSTVRSAALGQNLGRNVIGTSECQLVNGANNVVVDPIDINCTSCIDSMVTVTGTVVCSSSSGVSNVGNVTVQFIPCEKKDGASCTSSNNTANCGLPLMTTPTFSQALPTTGIFSATVPANCYLVRFVCTTSPTTILTSTPSLTSCRFFCQTGTTNLGTITLSSSCTTCLPPKINITGAVTCLDGTISGITEGLIVARLLQCVPTSSTPPGSCGSVVNPLSPTIVAESVVSNLDGSYSFNQVVSGCYSIRFFCQSCTSTNTDVGGIACSSYTANTTVPTIQISCGLCGTIQVSGTVTCTTGTVSNVAVGVNLYANGCGLPITSTIYLPVSGLGGYSLCVAPGTGVSVFVVCAATRAQLSTPTTCITIIDTAQIINISDANCVCATSLLAGASSRLAGSGTKETRETKEIFLSGTINGGKTDSNFIIKIKRIDKDFPLINKVTIDKSWSTMTFPGTYLISIFSLDGLKTAIGSFTAVCDKDQHFTFTF